MIPSIVVRLETGDKYVDVTFVLDTGAAASCLSIDVVKKMGIDYKINRDEAVTFRGIGGESKTHGTVNLLTRFVNCDDVHDSTDNGITTSTAVPTFQEARYITFQISNDNHCLFGTDVLMQLRASICYSAMRLNVRGKYVHMQPWSSDANDRIVIKSTLRPDENALIALIMKNLTDNPNDHKYQSLSLDSRRIKALSNDGLSVLRENGFVDVDRHLVYIV
jgi:hypothetical protein